MQQDPNIIELYKQNMAINEKTIFMLLTASTASIAYILTQVSNMTWDKLIYLPMFSLIFLASSFGLGCIYLNTFAKLLNHNRLMLYHSGSEIGNFFKNSSSKLGKLSDFLSLMQQISFMSGAIIYAAYVFIKVYPH